MTREEIFAVVKENMASIIDGVDVDVITEDQSMNDYGADSLEIVEVVSRSMKQLRLRIPRTKLLIAKNLSDLLDLFEEAEAKDTAAV